MDVSALAPAKNARSEGPVTPDPTMNMEVVQSDSSIITQIITTENSAISENEQKNPSNASNEQQNPENASEADPNKILGFKAHLDEIIYQISLLKMKKSLSPEEAERLADLKGAQAQVMGTLDTICKVLNLRPFEISKEKLASLASPTTPPPVTEKAPATKPQTKRTHEDNSESFPGDSDFQIPSKRHTVRGTKGSAPKAAARSKKTDQPSTSSANRFEHLSEQPDDPPIADGQQEPIKPKIPPLLVQPGKDWCTLLAVIRTFAPDITSKLQGNFLKITCTSDSEFRNLVAWMEANGVMFKTYNLKE